MKKTLAVALALFTTSAQSTDHLLEFKFEKRGQDFERHFAELHSAWGKVGSGILNTTLELNGTTTKLGTTTNIHPGLTYLVPITENWLMGIAAKYNYVVNKSDALKAGVGWAYLGFESIDIAGQVRLDQHEPYRGRLQILARI